MMAWPQLTRSVIMAKSRRVIERSASVRVLTEDYLSSLKVLNESSNAHE
jgi:hypothetical protein